MSSVVVFVDVFMTVVNRVLLVTGTIDVIVMEVVMGRVIQMVVVTGRVVKLATLSLADRMCEKDEVERSVSNDR